LKAVRGWER